MNIQQARKFYYHLKHKYLTMNNIVVAVALVIAAGWAWGSITMMQRNYALQRDVDAQKREVEVLKLEVANMRLEQNYYKSDEYKDLAAREHLGLASPGEKLLILPPNTSAAKREDTAAVERAMGEPPTNFEQWINFLIGNSAASSGDLQK